MNRAGLLVSVERLQVELVVDEGSPDHDRVEQDTEYLLAELSQLELDHVKARSADVTPPGGVRGIGAVEVGSVLVALAGTRSALGALLHFVQDWVARRQSGTIKIKIDDDELELTFASRASQRRALEAFLDRHAR